MVCTRKLRSTCTRERKEEPSLIIYQHNVCYYVHAVSIFCILHPLPDYMVPLVERYQLGKVCIPQLSDGCHVPLPPKRVNPMVRVVKRMVVMVMTVIVFSCIVTQLVNFFFPPLHFKDRSDDGFPDQRRTLKLTLRPHSSCTTHICIYQLNFLSIQIFIYFQQNSCSFEPSSFCKHFPLHCHNLINVVGAVGRAYRSL